MKKLLTLAAILLIGMNCTMAQKRSNTAHLKYNNTLCDVIKVPKPHNKVMPGGINEPATVSYNAVSTVLKVKFSSHSHGGTVDVYHDGVKVAGITTNSGTTFSCILREYGTGNYNVIVSTGNTVVDSKNYTVQ